MMRLGQIAKEIAGDDAVLRGTVQCAGSDLDGVEIWFRYPADCFEYLSDSADPWLAALLMPAMRLGRTLCIDATASPRLLRSMETFMQIMRLWDSGCRPVTIRTKNDPIRPASPRAIGSFFSGGLDSFFTVLRNINSPQPEQSKVSHLIFVRGFDIRLDDDPLYEMCLANVRKAADKLGRPLLVCATNIKEALCPRPVEWEMYFGAALAGVALGTERLWKQVFIPAGLAYCDLIPHGSHPLIDPLWSTEQTQVIHDGAEATRIEKVLSQIAHSPVALEHLRVCWENRQGKYNCGLCEKCIRTMVNLEVAGVLDKCKSFDRKLKYSDIVRIPVQKDSARVMMLQNYKAALDMNCDPKLIRALNECLSPRFRTRLTRLLWSAAKKVSRPVDKALLAGKLAQWSRTRRTQSASR